MCKFETATKVNVNDKTEKKGNLTYLSWAWAWAEFKKIYPEATYEVKKFDGMPYVHDTDTGYMVYTSVTADGLTYEMWLPVMDSRNKTLMNATMFDINKTIMRCLTKNLAMFGLGLYIYAGEDLPEDEEQKPAEPSKKAKKTANTEVKRMPLEEAQNTEFEMGGKVYKVGNLSIEWLERNIDKTQNDDLKTAMQIVLKFKKLEAMEAKENE